MTPPPGWVDQGIHLETVDQLRERFGEPPGRDEVSADKGLMRTIMRSEVLLAWKNKKKSSKPGGDGIQYCVRSGLLRRRNEKNHRDDVPESAVKRRCRHTL